MTVTVDPVSSGSGGKPSQHEETSPETLPPGAGQGALKLETIKDLHWNLASRYVEILDTISSPGLLPREWSASRLVERFYSLLAKVESVRTIHKNASRRRPVTRALAESHIKHKLQELQANYAQVEQSLPTREADKPLKEWLKESQDSCSRWASTLTGWGSMRALLTILWPAILGLATAWLGADTIWKAALTTIENVNWSQEALFATQLAIFTIMYAGILIALVYRRKRRLFLETNLGFAHNQPASAPSINTYQLEDALFNYLRKQKRMEAPIDTAGALAIVIMFIVAGGVVISYGGLGNVIAGVLGILFFGAMGLAFVGAEEFR